MDMICRDPAPAPALLAAFLILVVVALMATGFLGGMRRAGRRREGIWISWLAVSAW